MHDFQAIGLFCEDIREEKSGSHSLIGMLGDDMAVPGFPGLMPKLSIYVRVNLKTESEPLKFQIFLNHPNGERILINTIEESLVAQAIRDSKAAGRPLAGIFSHMTASPFPVQQAGRVLLELQWASGSMIIAGLNFLLAVPSPPQGSKAT